MGIGLGRNAGVCDDRPHEFEALQVIVAGKRDCARTRSLELGQQHWQFGLEAVEGLNLKAERSTQAER